MSLALGEDVAYVKVFFTCILNTFEKYFPITDEIDALIDDCELHHIFIVLHLLVLILPL